MSEFISDEAAMQRRIGRCIELAAIFKEEKSGNTKTQKRIIAKFSLQEGVSNRKATQYFMDLVASGLIVISPGKKRWRYVPEAEWDQFTVNI